MLDFLLENHYIIVVVKKLVLLQPGGGQVKVKRYLDRKIGEKPKARVLGFLKIRGSASNWK